MPLSTSSRSSGCTRSTTLRPTTSVQPKMRESVSEPQMTRNSSSRSNEKCPYERDTAVASRTSASVPTGSAPVPGVVVSRLVRMLISFDIDRPQEALEISRA